MRRGMLILVLSLVGCAIDDDLEEEWNGLAPQQHDPDGFCPSGGGGVPPNPGADPNPIPAPRDCTREPTWEQCYDCCDWNSKHVWEEMCRRIPKRKERAACWKRVEKELRPGCYKACNRPGGPIITVAP